MIQIAVTQKLAKEMKIKPDLPQEGINTLFNWTATWTNTFHDRKEDLLVVMNNESRFPIVIHGIRKNQFKNIEEKIIVSMRRTLEALNLNPKIIELYMNEINRIEFVANKDRKITAAINRMALDSARIHGNMLNNGKAKASTDTVGVTMSRHWVRDPKNKEKYMYPQARFFEMLSVFYQLPMYDLKAFEITIALDLDVHIAKRKIVVPSYMTLLQFHEVIQEVFNWKDYHLYEFQMLSTSEKLARNLNLEAAFNQSKKLNYIYDFGDYWIHEIELSKVHEHYHEPVPFLLEAEGQAPPEDVGGIPGFNHFLEAMKDENHPDHDHFDDWLYQSGQFWRPELSEWEKKPKYIEFVWRDKEDEMMEYVDADKMSFEEDSKEEYDEELEHDNIEKEAEALLDNFWDSMIEEGLSDSTTRRHYRNVEFYINYFLVNYQGVSACEGWREFHLDEFFIDFYPRKAMWSTSNSTKQTTTGLKKFYKFLHKEGQLSEEALTALNQTIKRSLESWMTEMDIYNDPDNDLFDFNPFANSLDDSIESIVGDIGKKFTDTIMNRTPYLIAATNLYGLITIDDFVKFYNQYEDDKLDKAEATMLARSISALLSLENEPPFYVYENQIAKPIIASIIDAEFEGYDGKDEFIERLANSEKTMKGRYYPAKEEVLNHADPLYLEPEELYEELQHLMLEHGLVEDELLDDGVSTKAEVVVHKFSSATKIGMTLEDYFNYFKLENGITFEHLKTTELEKINALLKKISKHVRMYVNAGFNEIELEERGNAPHLRLVRKVGRNDPCPCDSGKKYKKCCG